MCTVLLSPGINPIAFDKCIISYQNTDGQFKLHLIIRYVK